MSHSKRQGRGKSYYLANVNPTAQRFIVSCSVCGHVGFEPRVLGNDFVTTTERKVIKAALQSVLGPLQIDASGRCETCKRVTEEV
jgi:hypothetical protein